MHNTIFPSFQLLLPGWEQCFEEGLDFPKALLAKLFAVNKDGKLVEQFNHFVVGDKRCTPILLGVSAKCKRQSVTRKNDFLFHPDQYQNCLKPCFDGSEETQSPSEDGVECNWCHKVFATQY
jgi:hypothetical protein